MVLFNLWF